MSAIDLYCERVGPAFWAEPLNAVSNLAFVIAALLVWRLGQTDWVTMGLIVLGGANGVGSFLFHTFAQSWAELADVVPIWSFVALYVLVVIYRYTGGNALKIFRILGIVGICVLGAVWLTGNDITTEVDAAPVVLNGSLQYVPAVIALGIFAVLTQVRGHPARHLVAAAAGVFVLSLVFRTVDLAICDVFPMGSHFMWHLLNSTMVGLLLTVLVLHVPRRE